MSQTKKETYFKPEDKAETSYRNARFSRDNNEFRFKANQFKGVRSMTK